MSNKNPKKRRLKLSRLDMTCNFECVKGFWGFGVCLLQKQRSPTRQEMLMIQERNTV